MASLSVIRRWYFRDHLSFLKIARHTRLSRNTVRKYLRSTILRRPALARIERVSSP